MGGHSGWLGKLALQRESPVPELEDSASEFPDPFSEAEQLLTSYFSASTVGFCILDSDLRYLTINHSLAAMHDLSAEAHLGKTVGEVLGDVAQNLEPALRQVLTTGQPVRNFEISATYPTRTEPGHWVEHFFPVKNPAGEVIQIGAVVMEITEQKKLEESVLGVTAKLREEKRRLEVLLETGRLLAANWNVKTIFPRVSAYLRRILRQEYASLALLDEESGTLVSEVKDFPMGTGLSQGTSIPLQGSPQGQALKTGTPLILSREEMIASPAELIKGFLQEGLKSLCVAPLMRPRGALGVLCLASTREGAFTHDDLPLITQVAAQFASTLENARAFQQVDQLKSRLSAERRYLEGEIRTQLHFEEIIGESAAIRKVLDQVKTVAESNATVLILGETGTGKELIARAIHRTSRRRTRPFVKLNCAAIPTGLVESELFGHEKGAFTGAVSQKIGRMELADRGTFFLDEVGDIPLEVQPKLLRVLQDHEFERLSGNRTIQVDVRLIAATNRDLAGRVARHEFRSDLYYRLNVFPIHLPPLRERREDIPLLVRYFVRKYAAALNHPIETIPSDAMRVLTAWHWPGNVRELENLIERSVILSQGSALHVPLAELESAASQAKGVQEHTLESAEREHIIRVLRETHGQISGPTGAARKLGLKRTTLQSKMQRLGISRKNYSDF